MEHLDHQQEDGSVVEVVVLEVLPTLMVDLILHLVVLVVVVMDLT